ncbi:MAG: DUF6691 family protein [Methylococcales bacterium]
MKPVTTAFLSGILFGVGLALSQMTNPDKVLNFLDIAGNWDPSLVLVMAGALGITFFSFRKILKQPGQLFEVELYPINTAGIDKPLIIGSAIFGIGWGIGGYCPGPVVAGLGLGNVESVVMVFSMYTGFFVHRLFNK